MRITTICYSNTLHVTLPTLKGHHCVKYFYESFGHTLHPKGA